MDRDLFMFYKSALEGKFTTPLCSEYKSAWRKCGDDKEMLVKLALKQQSIPYLSHACYKSMGLTKEYILNNFGELINGKRAFENVEGVDGYTYQLYVGYDNDFSISSDVTSMMWCNNLTITIPKTKCPTIYISNKGSVRLCCEGFNFVNIKLFDESEIVVDIMDKESTVLVYKYSNTSKVEIENNCFGSVKIFNKQLKL